jgi:hypothetical protein
MQGHFSDRFLAEDRRDLILRGIAWTGHRPVGELLTVRDAPAPSAGVPPP